MYQDPANTQRDDGQEGMLSGGCEYLTLHGETVKRINMVLITLFLPFFISTFSEFPSKFY